MSVPSALPEATGGVAIEYGLHDGPLIFTLAEQEARELHELLAEQLARMRTIRRVELAGLEPATSWVRYRLALISRLSRHA